MKKKLTLLTLLAATAGTSAHFYYRSNMPMGTASFSSETDIQTEYDQAKLNVLANNPGINLFELPSVMAANMMNSLSPGQNATLINITGRSAIGYAVVRNRPNSIQIGGAAANTEGPANEIVNEVANFQADSIVKHSIAIAEPYIKALEASGGGVAFIGAGGTLMGVGEFIEAIENPEFQKMLKKYPNVKVEAWGEVAHQAGSYNEKLYKMKWLSLIKDPTGYWQVVIDGISQTPAINIEFAKRGYSAPYIIADGGKIAITEALQLLFLIQSAAEQRGEPVKDLASRIPIQIQVGLAPGKEKGQKASEKGVNAGYEFLTSLYEMAKASTSFADSIANYDITVELFDGLMEKKQETLKITDFQSIVEALTKANNLKSSERRLARMERYYEDLKQLEAKVAANDLSAKQLEIIGGDFAKSHPNATDFTKAAQIHAVEHSYDSTVTPKVAKTLGLETVKERALWLKTVEFLKINSIVQKELATLAAVESLSSTVRSLLTDISSRIDGKANSDAMKISEKIKTKESRQTEGKKASGKATK